MVLACRDKVRFDHGFLLVVYFNTRDGTPKPVAYLNLPSNPALPGRERWLLQASVYLYACIHTSACSCIQVCVFVNMKVYAHVDAHISLNVHDNVHEKHL